MTLRIVGSGDAFGFDIIDVESERSVLSDLAALRLRIVLGNDGARLEADHRVEFDHAVPGAVRAFIGCPEAGKRRELRAVEYVDGGRVTFPQNFSCRGIRGDVEQVRQLLPEDASTTFQKVREPSGE